MSEATPESAAPASKNTNRVLGSNEVWNRPSERPGYLDGLAGLGGMVAPLLAGFSLTAIALLLTSTKEPRLWGWALLAFAGAVALLLHSMQLAFFSVARDPRPATQLDWYPEALIDPDAARDVRKRQAETYERSVSFWHRSMFWYDLGLTSFLAGLVLLLIPYSHNWTEQRIAAVVVAGAAFLMEVWWIVANRLWDWKLRIGGRTLRFPHPVISRKAPKIEVQDLDPALLWAIVDPGRFAAAADEVGVSSSDGSAPQT